MGKICDCFKKKEEEKTNNYNDFNYSYDERNIIDAKNKTDNYSDINNSPNVLEQINKPFTRSNSEEIENKRKKEINKNKFCLSISVNNKEPFENEFDEIRKENLKIIKKTKAKKNKKNIEMKNLFNGGSERKKIIDENNSPKETEKVLENEENKERNLIVKEKSLIENENKIYGLEKKLETGDNELDITNCTAKENQLTLKENKSLEKEKNLRKREDDINKREKKLKEKEDELAKNENKITERENELNKRENDFNVKEKKLKDNIKIKENELSEKENKLKTKKADFQKQTEIKEKELYEREEAIKKKEKYFDNIIKIKENEQNLKEIEFKKTENELKKREKIISEKEKAFKITENELAQKNAEILQLKKNFEHKEKEINNIFIQMKKENEPILVGLNNIGATCYMNATLQALSNTDGLSEYFLKNYKYDKDNRKKIMSNEFYKVIDNLWKFENNNKSYSPYDFKETLSQENPLFAGIAANDSKDLINFLLERLHTELNVIKNDTTFNENYDITPNDQLNEQTMLNLYTKEMAINYNSIISNLFYGVLETKSQCQGCKNIKFNFQIYSFIEFPLERVNLYCFNAGKRNNYNMNNNKNPDVDLYECFEYYGNVDLMTGDNQMYCNICNCLKDALYGTLLYSAPNYLIINLNRGRGAVYECKVNFPEQLNIYNFVTYKNGNTVFELYAVICHIGPSSMSGHFVAYCKNKRDKKWYLFNDGMVSKCNKPYEYQNGMPYILFYQVLKI